MSEEVEKTEEKKGVSAKTVSLIGKIVGGLVILIGFVLNSFNIWSCDTDDLIKVGFSIMAVFGTVDINIALDKFIKRD